MPGSPTLINVSNRLPVTIADDGQVRASSGGLVTAMQGLATQGERRLRWIGWPGSSVDDPDRQAAVARTLEGEHGYSPVFLTSDEHRDFYEGFSNSSLWPLLHYLPSLYRYEPGWWEAYEAVNRKFADAILKAAEGGGDDALVWVHDYQLMLVPAMLKAARPELRVGFFLHTPFPAYELFRCHPRRAELVRGLLGADQVGFHTFDYLCHFCTSVRRLAGFEPSITAIRHAEGRETRLAAYPIGIDVAKFEREVASEAFDRQLAKIGETFGAKRLVLSVERLDYTKGILRRLEAIDRFLAAMPNAEDRNKVKFIFIAVPSREGVEEYKTLREEVETLVGRINGQHATLENSPIHFLHASVSFTELCALYAAADVAVVTPLIDGMNLVAKEYVACQGGGGRTPGVLVLSEFAGAAQELFGALVVNPYDAQQTADAIRAALAMGDEEKRRRMDSMRRRVREYDAPAWAKAFVDDLAARPATPRAGAGGLAPMAERVAAAEREVRDAVTSGRPVWLFLDYDGTLREFELKPADASPNAAVRSLLDRLAAAPANVRTAIVSGRDPHDLEGWLGGYPFALVGDHGASLRRGRGRSWERLDRNTGYGWKAEVIKVLRLYASTTPGSTVEDKRTSLVFHYRGADPDFGTSKARQLSSELAGLLANEPVEVRQGNKIVEVAAARIDKGAAVAHLVEDDPRGLVLCVGDDTTDESMFPLDIPNLLTFKVGEGLTRATLRLADPAAVRKFLMRAVLGEPA